MYSFYFYDFYVCMYTTNIIFNAEGILAQASIITSLLILVKHMSKSQSIISKKVS